MLLFETRRTKRPKRREGFTLIEILLVIAIIGVLTVIIGSALDIPLLLVNSRDSERKQQVKTLENAMYQHLVDEWELANDTEIPEGDESDAKNICREGVIGDATCVNLDALIPAYLPSLPIDITETNPNFTGYKVYKRVGRPRILSKYLGTLPE
jgi:prepilin-type N-terminal cleavage/methylation domain-containing protein